MGYKNQSKAKELLKLSWDEVHLIQEKAVQRGLKSAEFAGELKHLGVDEKSFLKGHQYATILSDQDHPRVLDVARDRKEESLGELLNKLPESQRDNIEAVAMDMWEPFINAVEQYLPQADIVHDKFHIAKYLGEAVDKVRRAENRNLVNQDKDTLKGTKYLWLTNPNNWSEQQEASFNKLKDKGLKVGRAWSIKEMFSGLWDYRYEKAALEVLQAVVLVGHPCTAQTDG